LLAINIANKVSISKLILVASTPNFVRTDNWEFGIDANNFEQFSDSLQLNLSKGLKRFVSLQTKDRTQIKHLNQTIDNYPATTQALNQGLNILLKTNLIKTLESLSVEKEVILGKNDTLVPNKIAKWYQQNNIKTQLLNTGHLPFLCDDFLL